MVEMLATANLSSEIQKCQGELGSLFRRIGQRFTHLSSQFTGRGMKRASMLPSISSSLEKLFNHILGPGDDEGLYVSGYIGC